jgi:hypothetical protein
MNTNVRILPVIVPAYFGGADLEACLASVERQGFPGLETFVHDNSAENLYYTAAVNLALRKYAFRDDVEYVFVLNQDAALEPESVHNLVRFMDANPRCGIGCPVQVARDDPDRVTFGGGEKLFPWGHHYAGTRRDFAEPRRIYWASGAAMMLRTEMLREIGLLDRNLRHIGSDSDLSLTARSRGWESWLVPDAVVRHAPGSSLDSGANRELEIVKLTDLLYFAAKWLTGQLYRDMSVDGAQMTADAVAEEIRKLQAGLSMLRGQRQDAGKGREEPGQAGRPPIASVLNVGGGSKAIPIPPHYQGWEHVLFDIDPSGGADIVGDARQLAAVIEPQVYDAVYCSHNVEHYYEHDVARVLQGFAHALKPSGFAEIRVPDFWQVMRHALQAGLDVEDELHASSMGPVRVLDVLYGMQQEIARSGRDYYAHKSAFSPASLARALQRAGFVAVYRVPPLALYEFRVIAFKNMPDATQRALFGIQDVVPESSTGIAT